MNLIAINVKIKGKENLISHLTFYSKYALKQSP